MIGGGIIKLDTETKFFLIVAVVSLLAVFLPVSINIIFGHAGVGLL